MKPTLPLMAILGVAAFSSATSVHAGDSRLAAPKTLNTLRSFPKLDSLEQWKSRAADIREHVQVSCGLWPYPEKTALNAQVTGKVERDGYSIEKVSFESYPGFFVAGNLYRPLGKGNGPFPAILNPHGHWSTGRMADTPEGSIAARCINFAKQGMVAFSWDMVGYNDTRQVDHKFASGGTNQLWQISLMGLQTWNSVRALDFLVSLPDVDQKRLACTGESGGGTQTFMLGALDDRLAVLAPIVMVSHSMQGGCLCENAPGLRVKYSNMEIAAQPAPRPQIIVSATGDWTKDTMKVEGPNIESIYKLFNAEDSFEYHLFDFGHNYNKTSREAVYSAFGRWLLNNPEPMKVAEISYSKEKDDDLKVFPKELPAEAKDEAEVIQSLVKIAKDHFQKNQPATAKEFEDFKKVYYPAWKHSFQVETISKGDYKATDVKPGASEALKIAQFKLTSAKTGQELPCTLFIPAAIKEEMVIVAMHPDGMSHFVSEDQRPKGIAALAVSRGLPVMAFDSFGTGALREESDKPRNQQANHFSVYNKTDAQERVQDIAAISAYVKERFPGKRVVLWGAGRAGLWTLLGAPLVDMIIADCDTLNESSDESLMAQDLFTPGLRRLGSFQGVASLAFPKPLLLHNLGGNFDHASLKKLYHETGKSPEALRVESARLDAESIMKWVIGSNTSKN